MTGGVSGGRRWRPRSRRCCSGVVWHRLVRVGGVVLVSWGLQVQPLVGVLVRRLVVGRFRSRTGAWGRPQRCEGGGGEIGGQGATGGAGGAPIGRGIANVSVRRHHFF